MREILFRGKRVDNGKWIFGSFLSNCNNQGRDCVMIKDDVSNINNGKINLIPIEVIPKSIGQYTGLKDSNDVKIFEGDILKVYKFTYKCENLPDILNVVFYSGCFELFRGNLPLVGLYLHYIDVGEVIGNINDNQELLKK